MGLALALLAGLTPLPVGAQAPELPPPSAQTAPAAPLLVPAPVPGVGAGVGPVAGPAAGPDGPVTGPLGWSFYASTGPVFPVAAGFQDRLNMGWTVQVGAREALTCPGSFMVFSELAGEYTTEPARNGQVENTDVIATIAGGASMLLSGFHRTELRELQHLGLHGGLGWTYVPGLFDEPDGGLMAGDGRLFLIGRFGADGGLTHAIVHEDVTTSGRNDLIAFEVVNGNRQGTRPTALNDLVRTHNPYVGLYATLGVGMTWKDASLGSVPLGDVSVAAEVQLGYQWDDIGQFEPNATTLTLSPLLTLAFAF
jgi:hypothetical protein